MDLSITEGLVGAAGALIANAALSGWHVRGVVATVAEQGRRVAAVEADLKALRLALDGHEDKLGEVVHRVDVRLARIEERLEMALSGRGGRRAPSAE